MIEDPHSPAHSPPRGARKAPGRLSGALGPGLALTLGRAIGQALGATLDAARGAIYPDLCLACRAETSESDRRRGLCAQCWPGVSFIAGPTCRTCGAPVPGGMAETDAALICDGCVHAPPAWSHGAAAVVYEGIGRSLVLSLKHGDRLDIAPVAAGWMIRAGRPLVASADVIAPAPMHWRRLLRRRFNQAGELAREIAVQAGRADALALDLLARARATPTQEGRNRAGRVANVAGAMRVSPEGARRLAGRRVLLVDDVLTTGATLSACAAACYDAGAAEVNALAFARVARVDWPT